MELYSTEIRCLLKKRNIFYWFQFEIPPKPLFRNRKVAAVIETAQNAQGKREG